MYNGVAMDFSVSHPALDLYTPLSLRKDLTDSDNFCECTTTKEHLLFLTSFFFPSFIRFFQSEKYHEEIFFSREKEMFCFVSGMWN